MEKSIESIWKEGFLKGDAFITPKLNNLYNKKSVHIIDKFKKMFVINIWGIIVFSLAIFLGAYFVGALIAGCIVLIMMLYVAYTAYNELIDLESIDKGQNSYVFLKSFKDWIDMSIEHYGKLYRIVYPSLILTFYFGIWFSDMFAGTREKVAEKSDLIFGVHIYTTILVIALAIVMSIFSKTIHSKDVKAIYGRILNKLDLVLAEMEELRN